MDKNIKIALILAATDRASGVMGRVFTKAEAGAKRLSTFSNALGRLGTDGIIAGGAITAFFGKTLKDAGEAVKATKRLNAAFDNLGAKGKEIAEQGKSFAEAYQFKIGVNAAEIQAAETRLAVFHKIFTAGAQQAQIFQRATKAAFDMRALGFGEDAASNAQKLGKLLNDPLNNLNSMGRILGKITPLQKAHIALLYAQKKGTEAQAYVLGMVEKKFQNAAEKVRSYGDLVKVQMHALSVTIGNELRPAYIALLTKVSQYLASISTFVKAHRGLVVIVAKTAAFVLIFSAGIRVLSFLLNTVALTAKLAKIASTQFGNILTWLNGRAFFATKGLQAVQLDMFAVQTTSRFALIPALQAAGAAILRFGIALLASPITWFVVAAAAVAAAVYLIVRNWGAVSGFFKRVWAGIVGAFKFGVQVVKFLLLNFTPFGLIIKYWSKLGSFFTGVWSSVKGVFSKAWSWFSGLTARFVAAGKNIVVSIAKGIWAVAMAPVRAIMWIVQKIRNFLPFSPAKEGPLRNIHRVKIAETIAASIHAKPMIDAWSKATGRLYGQMNRPGQGPAPAYAATTQIHFNPVIHMHGGTAADGRKVSEQLRADFERLMKDHEHQQARKNFSHK